MFHFLSLLNFGHQLHLVNYNFEKKEKVYLNIKEIFELEVESKWNKNLENMKEIFKKKKKEKKNLRHLNSNLLVNYSKGSNNIKKNKMLS